MNMNGNSDLISVIIPVWNGAAYVREAIESVLRQSMNVEIIVVDDGSTDGSQEALSGLGCILVPITHSGISRACNTGMAHATGGYVMILDQDDLLCNGSLRKLLDAFTRDEAVQALAAKARDFVSPDLDDEDRKYLAPRPEPYHGLMTGCVLLRRDALERVGGFNESYRAGQAVDYLLRIERNVICKKVDIVSAMRRLHAANTGRTMKNTQFRDYGSILRARLPGRVNNG